MARILKWMARESLHVLPAVIYFFIALNLFNITFGWMFHQLGVQLGTFTRIIVASIIIGKVMLVANNMPFLNIFSNKPLIYSTIWKTAIYFFFSFLVRIIEYLVPLIAKYKDVNAAYQQMMGEIWWPRFWTIQVWFLILLLLFVVSQGLIETIGPEKMKKIFFGPK